MDQQNKNRISCFIFQDSGEFEMLKGCVKDNLCLCLGVSVELPQKKRFRVNEQVDRNCNRMSPLTEESLLSIIQTWFSKQEYKQVCKIISGVASIVQGQLIQLFSKLGLQTITVWDNIIPNDNGEYWKCGQQVQHQSSIT